MDSAIIPADKLSETNATVAMSTEEQELLRLFRERTNSALHLFNQKPSPKHVKITLTRENWSTVSVDMAQHCLNLLAIELGTAGYYTTVSDWTIIIYKNQSDHDDDDRFDTITYFFGLVCTVSVIAFAIGYFLR